MTTATTVRPNRWALVWHPGRSPIRDSSSAEDQRRSQCRSELRMRFYRSSAGVAGTMYRWICIWTPAMAQDHFQFAPVRVRPERRRDPIGRRSLV